MEIKIKRWWLFVLGVIVLTAVNFKFTGGEKIISYGITNITIPTLENAIASTIFYLLRVGLGLYLLKKSLEK